MATPFFWLAYTGEIPKKGPFSTILPFYVLGTMFLQYKWWEVILFILGFKTVRPRPTGFLATPYFLQVKFRKMAFSARSFHFMFLELFSFNIDGRKAFRLFLVSKLYGHVQTVFWPCPFYADKIAKNGILAF